MSSYISDSPTVQPKRVAADEIAVKVNGNRSWLYTAINLDTKVILDVTLFERHGTDPAVVFHMDSPKNTTVHKRYLSQMPSTIGLPSLD
jgi:transposase-like protein